MSDGFARDHKTCRVGALTHASEPPPPFLFLFKKCVFGSLASATKIRDRVFLSSGPTGKSGRDRQTRHARKNFRRKDGSSLWRRPPGAVPLCLSSICFFNKKKSAGWQRASVVVGLWKKCRKCGGASKWSKTKGRRGYAHSRSIANATATGRRRPARPTDSISRARAMTSTVVRSSRWHAWSSACAATTP